MVVRLARPVTEGRVVGGRYALLDVLGSGGMATVWRATDQVLGLLPVLRRLPRRLDRLTTSLERGTLTTSVRLLADDRDRHFVASMAGRAVLAFLGAAFGIISVMLLGVRGGPLLVPAAARTGGTSLFHAFGYAGLFFSLVLTLRVIIAITREGI